MRNSTTKFSIAAAAGALVLISACGGKSTPSVPSDGPTTPASPTVTAEATEVPVVATTTTSPAPILFTVDGTDPRAPGGAVATTARRYDKPFTLDRGAKVLARVRE